MRPPSHFYQWWERATCFAMESFVIHKNVKKPNTMVIDGRAIAEELKEGIAEAVRERRTAPTLVLIVVGSNPVTEQFIKIKKKFAEEVGVLVSEIRFPETATF